MSETGRRLAMTSVFLAGFAALLAVFFSFTAEDAWIVARYARNAVEHGELVFNRGEFVNALTSPLDAALRIALHAWTAEPMLAHKIVATACSVSALAIGVWVLRTEPAGRMVFLALTALSAPLVLWTVGGLETPLLVLLITAFTACLWPAAPRLYGAALLAGLAFLARHDSVLFTAPALLWAVRDQPFRRWIAGGAVAAVLPLAWLAFALVYFHDALPTSFHIKGPAAITLTLGLNAVYLIDFLLLSGVVVVLAAAFAQASARLIVPPLGAMVRRRAGFWAGLAVAVLGYGLLVATAHMMFSFRLFVPYLPAMALLTSELFAAAGHSVPNARRVTAMAIAVVIALQASVAAALVHWSLNPSRVGEYQYVGTVEYRHSFIGSLSEAAAAIEADWRAHPPAEPRAPRIVTFAAGLLPWRLPDAYIFEALVSWRRACLPDRRQHAVLADYVHLMTPWFGPLSEQLPGPPERWETVWQRTASFDGGSQTWMVMRNRAPDPAALPAYVDGPCRLPAPQVSQTR
jgi:arabinofuranosyltransferase